jgi:type IV pilus assembly protein PilQ
MMGVAAIATAQPAFATAQVTAVQVNSTTSGMSVLLKTQGSDRPQVFSVNRGKTWTADLVNTRLKLPQGAFQQANPAKGIAMITVAPLDNNSVRVTVTGQTAAPTGQVARTNDGHLVLNLTQTRAGRAASATATAPSNTALRAQQANPLPNLPASVQPPAVAIPQLPPASAPLATGSAATITAPQTLAQLPPAKASDTTVAQLPSMGAPMIANPDIKIDGNVYTPPPPVPPNAPIPQPRAIAPPVGDIAVGQIDSASDFIDLGTAERIPRLVLRDASAREVLSLLARAAGLNLAYAPRFNNLSAPGQPQLTTEQEKEGQGPKVTLDIENEPIQNVFNYVLQMTGLEANRIGQTVIVGPRLPDSARSNITRTLRLNQVTSAAASAYLSSLGASTLRTVEVTERRVVGVGEERQIVTTTNTEIRPLEAQQGSAPLVLRGLAIATDERLNSITLSGPPRKVAAASALLGQLDARRRQVAVNVRVIDIDLLAFDRAGTSFSFGVNDSQFVNTGGILTMNFGRNLPGSTGLTAPLESGVGSIGAAPTALFGGIPSNLLGFQRRLLLQVQAAVTNGNAKILTDPTLVVQEGQRAEVQLAQEVITNIRQQTTASANSTQITVEVEKAPAGLVLPIRIDRIDDNGFVSLQVDPQITRPERTVNITFTNQGQTVSNPITLLARRIVNSGQVRLRDGQTLLLTGVIQDEDRSTATKIPILGDIPILGALFRRTERQNQRREVIVMLTPRILDDTDRSAFGYSYSPGSEVRKILENTQPR